MNTLTKQLVAATLCLLPLGTVQALDNSIKISTEHSNNLGVVLGKLIPVSHIPVLYAPAKIVVPPTQEYVVSAAQTGVISKLHAAIGDKVKQGQVLAQLHSADLLSLQQLYLKAANDLALGALSYQRDEKLFHDGITPERRWQETRSQYNALLSVANEHRQLLEMAGMSAPDIENLKKTHQLSNALAIRSPITGVIIEKMAVAGARIDSFAPLYRVANLDELWVEINIPQERIGQIKLGDKVLLENPVSDAHAQVQPLPVAAKITLLGQSVNPENQTILARAAIKGPQTVVRPGQRVNVQIIQPFDKSAFTVPNSAIAQNEGKAFVFVQTPEGFTASPVTVIGKQQDESTISGALTGSENIAVQGAVALKANWLGLGSDE